MPKAFTDIRVMISSRNSPKFPYKGNPNATLSQIRKDLVDVITSERLFGEELFEVWINETAPAADAADDLWETCLAEVRKAAIVIVLYNGDSGWAKAGGEVGICHAELMEGLNTARGKVRVLQLAPLAPLRKGADGVRDERFREYVAHQYPLSGDPCTSGEQVIDLCRKTLREAVAGMTLLGVREARKGKFYSGDALDWTRLDFRTRQAAMVKIVVDALAERGAAVSNDDRRVVFLPVEGNELVVVCSAIPASMSVPEAREGVSQVFLHDHERAALLNARRSGPVHFIACHRSVTESQAIRQLGFPDATIVSAPFGVYVADDIQKVQLFFLTNCRDPTMTRYQVQRVFDWIEEVGEGERLAHRAAARARIVQAIAKEQAGKARAAGRK